MVYTKEKYGLRKLIGLILGPLLFIFLLLIKNPDGMTPNAGQVAAIALLMAVWWISEAIPISATALLPLFLFPILGVMKGSQAAAPYANQMVFLFLGGFLIALAMERWNLHRRLALHIIKIVGVSPKRLVFGFMLATAFLSMWISNTATAMMMLPIAMAVVIQLSSGDLSVDGSESGRREIVKNNFGLVLMLGIAYGASIGGIGTLIGTPPNIVLAGFFNQLFPDAPEIGFLQWMMVGLPLVAIFLPLAWFYLINFVSPVKLTAISLPGQGKRIIEKEIGALGKMGRGEFYVLIIFVLTAFLWIFRRNINLGAFTIPGWSNLLPHPSFVHDSTVAMAMGTILFLVPVDLKQGKFLMDWKTTRQLPWGILILFGGGFSLAEGFKSSGLDQWIGQNLIGLKGVSPFLMTVFVCLMVTFLTELTSNTATATMMMPILAFAAVAMGFNPLLLMIPGAISASCAFMLPVATPPNAIVFGSGWVTIPSMAKAGITIDLFGVVIITAIMYTIALYVFGISLSSLPPWALIAK